MASDKRRQSNTRLRWHRENRGWSLRKVADLIAAKSAEEDQGCGITDNLVGRWERGAASPGPFYREKLCQVFGLSAVELGLLEDLPAVSASSATVEPATESPPPPRPTEGMRDDEVIDAVYVEVVDGQETIATESSSDLKSVLPAPIHAFQDIALLKHIAGVPGIDISLSPRVFLDSGLLDRLERAFAPRVKIDRSMLDSLQLVTFELKKQLVQGARTNWSGLLTVASNQLRLLINLLESRSGRDQQLTSFIGETCLLIGDVLFNRQDYQAATQYYEMALRAAQEASNMTLQAIVSGRYSLLLIDSHQYRQAQPFVEEALRLARPNASSIVCSWLWAVKAEMYANEGGEKLCLDAIEAAKEQLGRREERVNCYTFVAELVPSVYGTAKLLGYEGACYLQLKQPEQAQHVLAASQKSSTHPHHQSLVNTDFALTFIQQNAPREACTFAVQALVFVQQTGSTRALQRILSVRQALHLWDGLLEVRELDERIGFFTKAGE